MVSSYNLEIIWYTSVQFSSVALLCPTLCDPMDCSMPGFPVQHQLPKITQTHVHRVGDIQPSHPLSSPSPAFLQSFPASGSVPMSQYFASGGQSTEVSASASVLPTNIKDWFPLGWTGLISLQSSRRDSQDPNSKASVLRHSAFCIVQLSHSYTTTRKIIISVDLMYNTGNSKSTYLFG